MLQFVCILSGIMSGSFNPSRTDGDKSPRAAHTNCQYILRLSKPTDMTIHWKTLEAHFLMVPLVFDSTFYGGKMHFLDFSQKTCPSLKGCGSDMSNKMLILIA
jgi:hypothetical protein